MKLSMIGLGKMGANMTTRLLKGGHEVVVYDLNELAIKTAVKDGAIGANSLENVVKILPNQKIFWVMVPSGKPTEDTIVQLANLVKKGDIIIDGGNSNYKDTKRRAEFLSKKDIHFVDVGTSGGIWGITEGYSMMVGGEKNVVESINPIFQTLAPGKETGWGYVGPNGAGHFVKMIHNGIEYGLMQAYAEGFELMDHKKEFNLIEFYNAKIAS